MNPIPGWFLISWILKKMFDHKDRYITPEEYEQFDIEARKQAHIKSEIKRFKKADKLRLRDSRKLR